MNTSKIIDEILQQYIEVELEENNSSRSSFNAAMIDVLTHAYKQSREIEKLYSNKLNKLKKETQS